MLVFGGETADGRWGGGQSSGGEWDGKDGMG